MNATTHPLTVRNVKVHQDYDDNPDLSWLTQSYEEEGITPEEAARYRAQDAERLASYGESWYMTGIYATADIVRSFPTGGYQYVANARSGGLWGIESDSEESYFAEVAEEQLSELADILADMGIAKDQITAAIEAADR